MTKSKISIYYCYNNYQLQVFLLCLICRILFLKKNATLRIKQYHFYCADRSTGVFLLSCLQTKKLTCFRLSDQVLSQRLQCLTIILYFKLFWFLSLRFPLKNQVLYLNELSKFVRYVKYIQMGRLINIAWQFINFHAL